MPFDILNDRAATVKQLVENDCTLNALTTCWHPQTWPWSSQDDMDVLKMAHRSNER